MADGTNRYAYVGDNPVSRVDPSGRERWWSWMCRALILALRGVYESLGIAAFVAAAVGVCVGLTGFWLSWACGFIVAIIASITTDIAYWGCHGAAQRFCG